jgi:hypothetical protein
VKKSIDALGFVAYLFSDVLPYTVRELVSLALTNPLALGAVALVLCIIYKAVSVALRYSRVLALIGASYAVAVVLERYLVTR